LPKERSTVLEYHAVDRRVPFVGRATELHELLSFLKRGGFLTLAGAGGVGKSRLAHEALSRHAERHPIRTLFIPLAGVQPEAVVGTVMSALGVVEESGRSPIETIADGLRDRPLILVLDNCEHAPDEVAALIDGLRGLGSLTILATSQRRLDYFDERVLELGPFTTDDGVAFFIARAGIEPSKIDEAMLQTVGVIVERVDGLAVALDLAAARLASLSLDELANELGELRPYQLRSTRGSDPRHRTIGNVIAWTHAHLREEGKRAFAQASLFADEFDEDDLAALGDLTRDEVRAALDELIANSLAITTEFGYRMLLPIRAVAIRHLVNARNRRAIDEAFAVRMNLLATELRERLQSADTAANAVARLHRRYADFCSALAWALKRPQERIETVRAIPVAMMAVWSEGGRFSEGLRWIERLESVASSFDAALRGQIYYLGLCVAHAAAEYHRMVEKGPLTISAFTIAGDRLGLARAYNALAAASLNTGRLEDAQTYVDTALRLYEQVGYARGIGTALINRGTIYFDGTGDLARAYETFRAAVRMLEGPPDALSGSALGNLAEVEHAMSEFEASGGHARQAIEHFEAASSPPLIAWQHETLARSAIARARLGDAREHLLVACDLLRRTPQPLYLARLAEVAARLLSARGSAERAAVLYAAARRYRSDRALLGLGIFAREVASHERALAEQLGRAAMNRCAAAAASWDLSRLASAVGGFLTAE
jgi:predicted ATPase